MDQKPPAKGDGGPKDDESDARNRGSRSRTNGGEHISVDQLTALLMNLQLDEFNLRALYETLPSVPPSTDGQDLSGTSGGLAEWPALDGLADLSPEDIGAGGVQPNGALLRGHDVLRDVLGVLVQFSEDVGSDMTVIGVGINALRDLASDNLDNLEDSFTKDSFEERVKQRMKSYVPIVSRKEKSQKNEATRTEVTGDDGSETSSNLNRRRGEYRKNTTLIIPRRLLEEISTVRLEEEARRADASRMRSKRDKRGKNEYKCGMCHETSTDENHSCLFIRLPREALEEVREQLPKMYRSLLDLHNMSDPAEGAEASRRYLAASFSGSEWSVDGPTERVPPAASLPTGNVSADEDDGTYDEMEADNPKSKKSRNDE